MMCDASLLHNICNNRQFLSMKSPICWDFRSRQISPAPLNAGRVYHPASIAPPPDVRDPVCGTKRPTLQIAMWLSASGVKKYITTEGTDNTGLFIQKTRASRRFFSKCSCSTPINSWLKTHFVTRANLNFRSSSKRKIFYPENTQILLLCALRG